MTENSGRIRASNLFAIVIALLVWVAVGLQLWLTLQTAPEGSHVLHLVRFFSFFTVWTNLLVGLTLTLSLIRSRLFAGTGWRSALASYIALVALTFALLLSHLQQLEGLAKLTDTLFHEIVPALYVVWWFFCGQARRLRWREVFPWLLYPAVYLAYCLLYGSSTHWYPYPFVNVDALGYPGVAMRAAGVAAAALVLGLIVIAMNRAWMTPSRILTIRQAGQAENEGTAQKP